MKKYMIQLLFFAYFLLFVVSIHAQQVYTSKLTTKNYLDSVNIKRHKYKIDTNRIKIEVNHIIGISSFIVAIRWHIDFDRGALLQ